MIFQCILFGIYALIAGFCCLVATEMLNRRNHERITPPEILFALIFGWFAFPFLFVYWVCFRWFVHYNVVLAKHVANRIDAFNNRKAF